MWKVRRWPPPQAVPRRADVVLLGVWYEHMFLQIMASKNPQKDKEEDIASLNEITFHEVLSRLLCCHGHPSLHVLPSGPTFSMPSGVPPRPQLLPK